VDGALSAPASPLPGVEYHAVQSQQIHPALRLLLGSGGKLADDGMVVDFLQFAVHRRMDVNDLWVADRGGRVVWSAMPVRSPGRTMLLLVPGGLPRGMRDVQDDVAGNLIDNVCEHFAARGVLMAQLLIEPFDKAALAVYVAKSFRQMAELQYLQADLRRAIPAPALPDGFDLVPYSAEAHPLFASTIVHSYRDSLDCPGLNGLREIEDVIAGHKASGGATFDPTWWFILRERGQAVAVLLLAQTAADDTAELVYLGIVPEARGRGIGDLLMRQALHVVSTKYPRGTLALAVDASNAPALKLYHRHGMKRVGSKLALMRQLDAQLRTAAAPISPGKTESESRTSR
jgi:ribosomal protein S18 acetylase RimI-like enzyme